MTGANGHVQSSIAVAYACMPLQQFEYSCEIFHRPMNTTLCAHVCSRACLSITRIITIEEVYYSTEVVRQECEFKKKYFTANNSLVHFNRRTRI